MKKTLSINVLFIILFCKSYAMELSPAKKIDPNLTKLNLSPKNQSEYQLNFLNNFTNFLPSSFYDSRIFYVLNKNETPNQNLSELDLNPITTKDYAISFVENQSRELINDLYKKNLWTLPFYGYILLKNKKNLPLKNIKFLPIAEGFANIFKGHAFFYSLINKRGQGIIFLLLS
jgi:hypothetical protein